MCKRVKYIIKHINQTGISIETRYAIAKMIYLKEFALQQQSNKGVYIHINKLDDDTIDEIYDLIKTKLTIP